MKYRDLELPQPPEVLLNVGTRVGDRSNLGSDFVESAAEYPFFARAGYITIRPVKKHVWNVELTERGKRSIDAPPYSHEQKTDCDEWQVEIPLAKYDHMDVTGIVEDGARAKADASIFFVLTPAGIDLLRVSEMEPDAAFEMDRRQEGDELARTWLYRGVSMERLSSDIASLPANAKAYVRQRTLTFEKYDSGWRSPNHHQE